jgi:hypothetical protein
MFFNLHLLYIDPGTGSMLFSIIIGAAATLYFLFRAVIIKLKVFFSGGKKAITKTPDPYVIYSEGKQYWNVFKPVLDEFEKRDTELLYLTSSKDDPVFDSKYNFIRSEFIGEGNKAFLRLNFISAHIVLMTTPGLDVFQLKRSKMVCHYSHVLHAPSDATMYRLFGIDYYDSVLLTGDYQKKDIQTLEQLRNLPEKQLVTVGCTYLDEYRKKLNVIPNKEHHSFTVLVSPSWGASGILRRFGEKLLDPLIKTNWRIIIRPHPQSAKSESDIVESLVKRYSSAANLEWDYERENIQSLARADIMISDFSGIIFDYTFLFDKPVLYIKSGIDIRPYDAYDLEDELWQFKILKNIGFELKEEDFDSIGEVIKKTSDNDQLKTAREKAKNTAWQYPGEAGKRIADFMINTINYKNKELSGV